MTQSETTRLSQELHDGIAQDLVGLALSLDLILANSTTPLETRLDIRKVRLSISDLLERTRIEIHDLHQLHVADLFEHIRLLANNLLSDYDVEVDLPDICPALSDVAIFQILRIVREALRNIVEHADASVIKVSAEIEGDGLLISIVNNGVAARTSQDQSFGLVGASKRAEDLHGSLFYESVPSGFWLTLRIPIQLNLV